MENFKTDLSVNLAQLSASTKTICELFTRIVERHAESPALEFEQDGCWQAWSYAELFERVSQLAEHFRNCGIKTDQAVGLIGTRHPDIIASLIAIIQIGAHYVPLNPRYPEAHLETLCNAAGIEHIFTVGAGPQLPKLNLNKPGLKLLTIPSMSELGAHKTTQSSRISGETAAYIMFTSGSTGTPKGVVVPHRAVTRLVHNTNFVKLSSASRTLCHSPLNFDASTFELWASLLNGGTCVLMPNEEHLSTDALLNVIQHRKINTLWLTSSLFNSITDSATDKLLGVQQLLVGGEALSLRHIVKAKQALTQTQLINGYGPTENTTFTCCYAIPANISLDEQSVPIGIPISGTGIAVVDKHNSPLPLNTEGELVAIGQGLALHYLNNDRLNNDRLNNDKLNNKSFVSLNIDNRSFRAYKTGDRVKMRTDGNLEFIARIDRQVKIDGHRIEPGEIEQKLLNFDGIQQVHVKAIATPDGKLRLVAYFVASDNPELQTRDLDDLRKQINAELPPYLRPHHLQQLASFPLTENGKLDITALPDPYLLSQTTFSQTIALPSEFQSVAKCWTQVLGKVPDSVDRSFFEQGGSSLDITKLQELLQHQASFQLSPSFVFEYPSIRQQSKALMKVSEKQEENNVPRRKRSSRRRRVTKQ